MSTGNARSSQFTGTLNAFATDTGGAIFIGRPKSQWPLANVTVKDQYYSYQAKRSWFDSETYAFNNATSTIDRDRFFVTHNQHIIGDNADLTWDSRILGMDNRFAAQLQVSSNWITFEQEGNPDAFPADTVSVINPSPGMYGPEFPNTRNSQLTDVAGSFEDRLKITPVFALIGGCAWSN